MKKYFNLTKEYFKKEKVLCISLVLAALSALIIPPDQSYVEYIDFRVLALLFCLMLLVKGFQDVRLFDLLINKVFGKISGSRMLSLILVLLCFFLSMLITNDVALLTFVPFAIMTLKLCHQEKLTIRVVVLQTMAANLGSMFTPIGNPQNLYLFSVSSMSLARFFKTMTPVTLVSLLLLTGLTLLIPNEPIHMSKQQNPESLNVKELSVYGMLFLLNLLVVFRVFFWGPILLLTVAGVILLRKQVLFKQVDYALLLTFIGFFIFVGNLGRIPAVSTLLAQMLRNREILLSAVFSQFLSNVPAAILLSGFTEDYAGLLIGTNVGGLGTLIASMASLISYKLYCAQEDAQKGKYFLLFTIYNVIGLAVLLPFSML